MDLKIEIVKKGSEPFKGKMIFTKQYEIDFEISEKELAKIHDNKLLKNIQKENGDNTYQIEYKDK